jgi:hypothetical protein
MDYLIKSRLYPAFVIPEEGGTILNQLVLDTRLHESDGFSVFF